MALRSLEKQWPVLNEVENSTANYVPWYGLEDIPFIKIIRKPLVRVARGSREKPSSTCSLEEGADSRRICNRIGSLIATV